MTANTVEPPRPRHRAVEIPTSDDQAGVKNVLVLRIGVSGLAGCRFWSIALRVALDRGWHLGRRRTLHADTPTDWRMDATGDRRAALYRPPLRDVQCNLFSDCGITFVFRIMFFDRCEVFPGFVPTLYVGPCRS
jgi:hypothetical protein